MQPFSKGKSSSQSHHFQVRFVNPNGGCWPPLPLRRRLYGDAILNCLGEVVSKKLAELLVMVSMKEIFSKISDIRI